MQLAAFWLLAALASPQISLRCFYYFQNEFMIYNLRDLNDRQAHVLPLPDGKVSFNLCYPQDPLPPICVEKGVKDTFGYYVSNDQKDCVSVLSSRISENVFEIRDPAKPDEGFDLASRGSKFRFHITCDLGAKAPTYSIKNTDVTITSRDACGIRNEAAKILDDNKFLISIGLMILGLFLLFFGGYKWKNVIGVMSFLIGCGGILFIFWAFISFKQTTASFVIISIIALLVGVFFAYLSSIFAFLSYVSFGFFAGFFLSGILLTTFQAPIEQWLFILIKFVVGGVLAIFCAAINVLTMVALTSIVGSFVFFFCLGNLVGQLPNVFELWEQIRAGTQLPVVYYVFFSIAVVFALGGMVFQYKKVKEQEREEGRKTYGDVFIER